VIDLEASDQDEGLGAVVIDAFDDDGVRQAAGMAAE
jgi:hypothetical protein